MTEAILKSIPRPLGAPIHRSVANWRHKGQQNRRPWPATLLMDTGLGPSGRAFSIPPASTTITGDSCFPGMYIQTLQGGGYHHELGDDLPLSSIKPFRRCAERRHDPSEQFHESILTRAGSPGRDQIQGQRQKNERSRGLLHFWFRANTVSSRRTGKESTTLTFVKAAIPKFESPLVAMSTDARILRRWIEKLPLN